MVSNHINLAFVAKAMYNDIGSYNDGYELKCRGDQDEVYESQ